MDLSYCHIQAVSIHRYDIKVSHVLTEECDGAAMVSGRMKAVSPKGTAMCGGDHHSAQPWMCP